MAFLAASLFAEVSGTLTLLIACSPVLCSVLTAASLVAVSILPLASLAASETFCFKAAFSSSVKFDLSIASSLV